MSATSADSRMLGFVRAENSRGGTLRPALYATAAVGALALAAGYANGVHLMELAGACALVASTAILAPEFPLALLMVIAGIKDAPFLSSLPTDATVLTAGAVLLACAGRAWSRGVRPFPNVAVFPYLLAALVVAAVIWSPDPAGGLSEATRFETLTLLPFFATFVIVRDETDLRRLMWGIVVFALVVVMLAVHTGDANQPIQVVGTTSGGEIELASDCAMGFFAAVYLALSSRGLRRLAAVAAGLYIGQTMIAAGSRGILVGLIISLVYVAFVTRRSWLRPRRLIIVLAGVAAVAILIPVIAGTGSISRYQSKLFTGDTSAVLGQRAYIFSIAEKLAIQHPLGLGAGGFQKETGLVYPHNIELHLAVNFGLLAVGLFIALLVGSWLARRRALLYGWRKESLILATLMIVLVTDSQVSNGLNNSPSRCMWLVFALCLVVPRMAQAAPRRAAPGSGAPTTRETTAPKRSLNEPVPGVEAGLAG